jgi:uncharacterized membrane protein
MFVSIAVGAFVLSFTFDLVGLVSGTPNPSVWNQLAYYTMIGGIVAAMAAALPRLLDLLTQPRQIKATALMHMAIDLTIVALYLVNAFMRRGAPTELTLPTILSLITIGMLLFSAWLGGKLVFVGRARLAR